MKVFMTYCLCLVLLWLTACTKKESKLFKIHQGSSIGIDFKNTITSSDTFNALSFEYIYNGSGVGIGDFNNDGLEDLFLGGNQVSCKLYVNKGGLKFNDVTQSAGITTDRWVTGVSVVDINQDGWLDVFLAVAGKTSPEKMRDLLFINKGLKNGVPLFEESAHAYGIDDEGYGTMGAFLDYDKDGDLDLYLLTNALESFNRNNLRPKRVRGEASSTDRLYKNNGDNTFTNASEEAGILIEGYGLGVNIADINQDSWPDIYVANDFMSNDLIWINQHNGSFKNMAGEYLKHQTHNGMGVDIADFNNDALADIMVVDMLPPGHQRQKLMTPGQNYDFFHMSENIGYEPQYMRNTLQLNRGKFQDKVLFSEIAFMSGVSSTDWSWAPLFADFDNDGFKDLFIANGYRKDVTNLDFIFFGLKGSPFGTKESRQQKFSKELNDLPEVKLSNYIFKNTGTLIFKDYTKEWGVELPTFSNGTAYADFDKDGDLDLITNNIDEEVILYENRASHSDVEHHYLQLVSNDSGKFLNQKIWVYTSGEVQVQELTPYRGFQSTVTKVIHFGLGTTKIIDSLKIVWPDSTTSVRYNVRADTILHFSKQDATKTFKPIRVTNSPIEFTAINTIPYTHREKSPSDIKMTRTLLHELSRFGPCAAKGDVNGDLLDDLFIGSEMGDTSKLFIQKPDGQFISVPVNSDTTREDGDALFFDSDNDGDADLYVASSCSSSIEDAKSHLLYMNDGKGNFTLSSGNLPEIVSSASCVVAEDYDQDGDLDLFVGGRIKPRAYPFSPRSYILQNNKGKFEDVTSQLNVALESPGMVSSALWTDINKDGKADLIMAGEWMPIRIFINEEKTFSEQTKTFGLENSHGWWNCLKAADLNNDGYVDIVAGNTGKNSFFKPTLKTPVKVTTADFDKNNSIDPIVTYYNPIEKDRFIIHNRLVLIDQVPGFKRRFETFSQYASTPFEKSLTKDELQGATDNVAHELSSILLINEQGKKLNKVDLPDITQISTINDILIEDLNNDEHLDMIIIGNNYAQETLFGRYDASIGTVLLGDGKLHWNEVDNSQCGFIVDKNAKEIIRIKQKNNIETIVIINNNGPLQSFRYSSRKKIKPL